jgi:release factor glutamine methyltransferase
MVLGDFLAEATQKLVEAGVESARLDVLILLEDVLVVDRGQLLAHPEIELSKAQLDQLDTFIAQRKEQIPIAYIRGKAAFFGRDFSVSREVLVPRPESEEMISLLARLDLPDRPVIIDIGTGSGCLGVTAALALPAATVYVSDISKPALKIATDNAKRLQASVQPIRQDLLVNDDRHYDVILANLPYVPLGFPVNKPTQFEPPEALFSGSDGLDHYRIFWQQVADRADQPTHVLTESLPSQHHHLALLARNSGYVLEKTSGFIQHFTI